MAVGKEEFKPSGKASAPPGGSSSSSSIDVDILAKGKDGAEKPRAPYQWTEKKWPRIIFADLDPFVHFGFKHRLETVDLFEEPSVNTKELFSHFEPAWEKEQKKTGEKKPFLLWALLAGNIPVLVSTGVLSITAQACQLAGPLLLQRIVQGLACQPYRHIPGVSCEERTTLYYYCIGLFLAPAIQAMCENHNNFMLYRLGTRLRNACMAAIYRKTLRLSNSSMQAESTGRVVTLMSNDAQKLQDAMFAIHSIWTTPCFIIAVLTLLWFQVGWATFVGLGIMLLLIPATGFLAGKLGKFRVDLLKFTEKRVGLMSEAINGIQMIKTYAWETSFEKDIRVQRTGEATIMRIVAMWQGVFGMVMFTGPVLVSIFCFGSWTLAGNNLSTAKAYTALAYFSLLRFPMTFLPMLITMLVNALISIKRIQGFLERGECAMAKDGPAPGEDGAKVVAMEKGSVSVKDADFVWDEALEKPTLSNISFVAKPGTLTMVVGSVGSGKSSLLASLLGHISKRTGSLRLCGRVAYVAQTAWIMNDTLQENVLIGSPMDEKLYRMAINASQLEPDLKIMDNGDLTEIGDRGITLSGGQKQRVSIARAVYADPDIVLLDDPLSAVDSHVGRALFETCIRGPLRNKTVILVTNALHYLPHADNIIWMEEGVIKGQGTYKDLVELGLNIAELAHIDDEDADSPDQETAGSKVDTPVDTLVKNADGAGKDSDGKGGNRQSIDINTKLTLTRQAENGNKNLTGTEEREEGNLGWGVVQEYTKCSGGWAIVVIIGLLMGAEQTMGVWTNRWVGLWFSDRYSHGNLWYLGVYLLFGVAYGLTTFIRSTTFLFSCVRAAVQLHNKLLVHVLKLPKSFFDTNPAGRILNRFSRDTDIMDNVLSMSLSQFLNCIATYIATLIVIAIATVWFAIAIPPLTVIYVLIQRYYIPTARELQRLESVTRSPIYTKFSEAMSGITTIRAYEKETHFIGVSERLMETNAYAYVTQKLAASWLAMRLDVMGLAILTGTGVLCIAGNIDPALAGLAILYALDLTRFLKHGTAMAAKSEADFNSVERIVQYLQPEPEAAPETAPELLAKMDPNWPSRGEIVVTGLQMRYRPDMPLVLKGISFRVNAGDKVGLVGRTGSGKSSLLLAMLRMIEAEAGSIVIDGVDIATLGVQHLRSKMSVIPQDPFMFSGNIRHNLDPFEDSADEELWEAVEAVGLKNVISELEGKMDYKVADNGANFSLGQRQLFCMARAMLRKSRILMLDEATASVDLDTDNLLQAAIRLKFAQCTMLTVAHRLNTIMDSDAVIVLDKGNVVENGEPHVLLKAETGVFTSMVNMSGRASSRYLKSLAKSASTVRRQDSGAGSSSDQESSCSDGGQHPAAVGSVQRSNLSGGLVRGTRSEGSDHAPPARSNLSGLGASHRQGAMLPVSEEPVSGLLSSTNVDVADASNVHDNEVHSGNVQTTTAAAHDDAAGSMHVVRAGEVGIVLEADPNEATRRSSGETTDVGRVAGVEPC